MYRIFELKLPFDHKSDALDAAVLKALSIPASALEQVIIRRHAIDARKKNSILSVYTVDAETAPGVKVDTSAMHCKITPAPCESYIQPCCGTEKSVHRPVVAGAGPAGLFAALILARAGYNPLLIERGKPIEERHKDVQRFWKTGFLDRESNAQFGEGGAGAFSDGKLTTAINDPLCRKVLDELITAGAPESIGCSARPHIGTDKLLTVVASLRQTIISLGGEVRFNSRLTDIKLHNNRLSAVEINQNEQIQCEAAVLAVGHSARDTALALFASGVKMSPKAFSIGVRIEHPQSIIDKSQYGSFAGHNRLPPSEYKMAFHSRNGRSAYTFCMCPGGQVIAAASHQGCVVTNGMSFFARNLPNANSGLLVNVGPQDFNSDHPLAGFAFQEKWERAAFELGKKNYSAPVQLVGDFLAGKPSSHVGCVKPTYRPGVVPADVSLCLPYYVIDTIREAIPVFARKLHGFDMPDAVLTGVETRSSSPVRMNRGEGMESEAVGGLYPAGEGAGYAGGIMSAAVDGIKCAGAIIGRYAPFEKSYRYA
jgi:uncharacterized FAD-dependent dehydrogenase